MIEFKRCVAALPHRS